jgi:uncharacterized protein
VLDRRTKLVILVVAVAVVAGAVWYSAHRSRGVLDIKSLRARAEKGQAQAQYVLGGAYYMGTFGVRQDMSEAFKWYTKAAGQGLDLAQCALGGMYQDGVSVSEDDKAAAAWYAKAAEQGLVAAQYSLGLMYARGEGVAEDNVEAYKWLMLAARGNNRDIREADVVRRKLSPEQVAEAEKRAREFKPAK